MVYHCYVAGCKSIWTPSNTVSFHRLPKNDKLRRKWLDIVDVNTENEFTKVCSLHFKQEDFVQHSTLSKKRLRRLKHGSVPTYNLDIPEEHLKHDMDTPLNITHDAKSQFLNVIEASDVEACRICLATDLKLYSLQVGALKVYMETITEFTGNCSIEGLPQFVCHECAAQLLKCYSLVERSARAQTVLIDIYAQNGKITNNLIKSLDRQSLNLTSLQTHNVTPTKVYNYQYDDKHSNSDLISTAFIGKEQKMTDKFKQEENVAIKSGEEFPIAYKSEANQKINYDVNDGQIDNDNVLEMFVEVGDNDDDEIKRKVIKGECLEKKSKASKTKTKNKYKSRVGVRLPFDTRMQEYFNIVKLSSLQEQMDEWQKSVKDWAKHLEHFNFQCEKCSKPFATQSSYNTHMVSHDPSHGSFECPVCYQRFKSEPKKRLHIRTTHNKKYYCRTCPAVRTHVSGARAHYKFHAGHVYSCEYCPFTSNKTGVVYSHARRHHAQATAWSCRYCGLAFSEKGLPQHVAHMHKDCEATEGTSEYVRCAECDVSFVTAAALRVHQLNASQHTMDKERVIAMDGALQTTCNVCGSQFDSSNEMHAHARAEHCARRSATPATAYPKKCDHCDETLSSRRQQCWHARQRHPREAAPRAVRAVCETCGKGCQDIAQLRLHELRHRSPSLRCASCPKLFHDRYRLAAHAARHGDARPYACAQCGRAFKYRANLKCHLKVHSDLAPYECSLCHKTFKYSSSLNLHVRSVHQKIPTKPRKPRVNHVNVINK